jgi:hypothetical protein
VLYLDLAHGQKNRFGPHRQDGHLQPFSPGAYARTATPHRAGRIPPPISVVTVTLHARFHTFGHCTIPGKCPTDTENVAACLLCPAIVRTVQANGLGRLSHNFRPTHRPAAFYSLFFGQSPPRHHAAKKRRCLECEREGLPFRDLYGWHAYWPEQLKKRRHGRGAQACGSRATTKPPTHVSNAQPCDASSRETHHAQPHETSHAEHHTTHDMTYQVDQCVGTGDTKCAHAHATRLCHDHHHATSLLAPRPTSGYVHSPRERVHFTSPLCARITQSPNHLITPSPQSPNQQTKHRSIQALHQNLPPLTSNPGKTADSQCATPCRP